MSQLVEYRRPGPEGRLVIGFGYSWTGLEDMVLCLLSSSSIPQHVEYRRPGLKGLPLMGSEDA